MATSVLVLRPSGSLYHFYSRHRHSLGDGADFRPAADVRLHRCRALAHCYRLSRLRPLGAPHVRRRPAAAGAEFFYRRQHADRGPQRNSDLCWIATLWSGRVVVRTPLLFVAGFIATFLLGDLTAVMQASVPFDLQVHDTFFVVAHFHYVLIGGAVFPLIGALYYWFPKITGRMMSERLGRWNFWTFSSGLISHFFHCTNSG